MALLACNVSISNSFHLFINHYFSYFKPKIIKSIFNVLSCHIHPYTKKADRYFYLYVLPVFLTKNAVHITSTTTAILKAFQSFTFDGFPSQIGAYTRYHLSTVQTTVIVCLFIYFAKGLMTHELQIQIELENMNTCKHSRYTT